jgi:hypothetical protein
LNGLIRAAALWPVLVLALGIAADAIYVETQLHPIYFTDDVEPYHGPWHAAYLGFEDRPDMLSPRARAAMEKYGGGDALGAWGDYDYLDKTHFIPWNGTNAIPPAVISPWNHQLKPRFHDEIMRRVLFDSIAHHPLDAFVLYAYLKPIAIYEVLRNVFVQARGWVWLWTITVGGILGGMILFLFTWELEPAQLARVLTLSAATIVLANLPGEWAYPGLSARIDPLLALVIFALLAVSAGCYGAIYLTGALFKLWQRPQSLVLSRLVEVEAPGRVSR